MCVCVCVCNSYFVCWKVSLEHHFWSPTPFQFLCCDSTHDSVEIAQPCFWCCSHSRNPTRNELPKGAFSSWIFPHVFFTLLRADMLLIVSVEGSSLANNAQFSQKHSALLMFWRRVRCMNCCFWRILNRIYLIWTPFTQISRVLNVMISKLFLKVKLFNGRFFCFVELSSDVKTDFGS